MASPPSLWLDKKHFLESKSGVKAESSQTSGDKLVIPDLTYVPISPDASVLACYEQFSFFPEASEATSIPTSIAFGRQQFGVQLPNMPNENPAIDRILPRIGVIEVQDAYPSVSHDKEQDGCHVALGSQVKCYMDENASQLSLLELPESQATASSFKEQFQRTRNLNHGESFAEGGQSISPANVTMGESSTENVPFLNEEQLSPAFLGKKSSEEVRHLFHANEYDIVPKLHNYWEVYKRFHNMKNHVQDVLENTGVKMTRRRRIASDIPALEKKQIRAQRNRERSQALRRHQKLRSARLAETNEQLMLYNSATRSLINCILEDKAALPLLQHYFAENKCSEAMLSFLNHES